MKKVLVIENDVDILDVIGLLLKNNGFDVLASQNRVPIESIIKQNPNVIIIDYLLSDSYGNEICKQVKANALTKHIPVILISTSNKIAEIAQDACADAYLSKPFDIEDLENIVVEHAI